MAELCKKCFIETWHPSQYDIDHIVMSEDNCFCEGCMSWGQYVDRISTDSNVKHDLDLDSIFEELIKNEQTNFNCTSGNSWFG